MTESDRRLRQELRVTINRMSRSFVYLVPESRRKKPIGDLHTYYCRVKAILRQLGRHQEADELPPAHHPLFMKECRQLKTIALLK